VSTVPATPEQSIPNRIYVKTRDTIYFHCFPEPLVPYGMYGIGGDVFESLKAQREQNKDKARQSIEDVYSLLT